MVFAKAFRDNFSLIMDRFTSILLQGTGYYLNFYTILPQFLLMTEIKVIDLLMCLSSKLYSDCFKVLYGSSITFVTDF